MLRKLIILFSVAILFGGSACQVNIHENKPDNINVKISSDFESSVKNENPMITKKHFGMADQKEVFLYTLDNKNGAQVSITNYGGIITSIMVPDKNDKMGDIVLGYDSLEQYIANNPYFGAIVGRYANRIAKGKFTLNGKVYQLAINNGKNSLHGGIKGFDKVVWDAQEHSDSLKTELVLTYLSKDGEEGYPGNLKVKVTYTLDIHNNLTMLIEAETDKPTPVNLCNHTYFNLSEADTNILGHHLTLYANNFTEVNGELIPTGASPSVSGTPMDFNNSQQIGSRIRKVKGGYDHNYVLKKDAGKLAMAAQLLDPRTGRQIEILTTQPGIQFYSGNFLDGTIKGKGGKIYGKHYGLCLETQRFPDSPNQPSFPNTILKPGEKYSETTIYRFSAFK
ncbi:MAG: galactose mutarotase [Bacteroidetes bacterium]|nr:galactose mutarotase [Bacteroidota bacterium]